MAVTGYKMYVSGYRFYVDEVVDSGSAIQMEGNAKDVLPKFKYTDSQTVTFSPELNSQTQAVLNGISFLNGDDEIQIFDANGDPYADFDTFKSWLDNNLGKSSSGSSGNPSELISDDADNALTLGGDNKLFVPEGSTAVPYKNSYNSDGTNPQVFTLPANTYVLSVRNATANEPTIRLGDWIQDGTQLTVSVDSSNSDVFDVVGITYSSEPPETRKVYRALVSQSGTDAPTAFELENTLGVVVSFVYNSEGNYNIIAADAFTENKVYSPQDQTRCVSNGDILYGIRITRIDENTLQMAIADDGFTAIDSALTNKLIEIYINP